jgi:hypothetical protein
MRVSDLIAKAEGLKKMPIARARIIRLKSDLTTEIVTLIWREALRGDLERIFL